jgi:hypothetical protein
VETSRIDLDARLRVVDEDQVCELMSELETPGRDSPGVGRFHTEPVIPGGSCIREVGDLGQAARERPDQEAVQRAESDAQPAHRRAVEGAARGSVGSRRVRIRMRRHALILASCKPRPWGLSETVRMQHGSIAKLPKDRLLCSGRLVLSS